MNGARSGGNHLLSVSVFLCVSESFIECLYEQLCVQQLDAK